MRLASSTRITRSRLSKGVAMQAREAAEGTRTRDARRPAPLDTEVVAIRRRSERMSDVTTRLEQVSRHLERAQRVLDDVNRVVQVADDVHTAVDQARHTVRNITVAGVFVVAVALAVYGAGAPSPLNRTSRTSEVRRCHAEARHQGGAPPCGRFAVRAPRGATLSSELASSGYGLRRVDAIRVRTCSCSRRLPE